MRRRVHWKQMTLYTRTTHLVLLVNLRRAEVVALCHYEYVCVRSKLTAHVLYSLRLSADDLGPRDQHQHAY